MADQQPTTTATDPVCGMEVDPATAKNRSEYRGETYYFCSRMCLRAFEDDPLRYLSKGRPGVPSPTGGR
jgi:Cu+-exporting ATPase